MRIEGCDLVDLGLRHLHLGRQRGQMRRRNLMIAVLNQMKNLLEVAPPALFTDQRVDLVQGLEIDLAAFRRAAGAAA